MLRKPRSNQGHAFCCQASCKRLWCYRYACTKFHRISGEVLQVLFCQLSQRTLAGYRALFWPVRSNNRPDEMRAKDLINSSVATGAVPVKGIMHQSIPTAPCPTLPPGANPQEFAFVSRRIFLVRTTHISRENNIISWLFSPIAVKQAYMRAMWLSAAIKLKGKKTRTETKTIVVTSMPTAVKHAYMTAMSLAAAVCTADLYCRKTCAVVL